MKRKILGLVVLFFVAFSLVSCGKKVKITFESNQESIPTNTITFKKGEEINLSNSEYQLSLDGFVFKGWYTDNTFQTGSYVRKVTADKNMILYAKWNELFTVSFDVDGGTAIEKQVIEKGDFVVQPVAPKKQGFVFTGWYTDKKLSKSYDFQKEVSSSITLYAGWKETFTVSFEANGGLDVDEMYASDGDKINLPTTRKNGYTFGGWFTDSELTNQAKTSFTVDDNYTLYAKWQANRFSIVFNRNTGEGTMPNQEFVYDIEQNISANNFVKEGYVFIGWNDSADGTGNAYTEGQTIKNLVSSDGGTFTLYAQWRPVKYIIKFDGNGATSGSIENQEFTYDEAKELSANTFTRTGYTFIGWGENASDAQAAFTNHESINNLLTEDNALKTLYAIWEVNNYEVVFDKNNETATGEMGSQGFKYNQTAELIPNNYKLVGYSFIGWNEAADGTGNAYEDSAEVSGLRSEPDDSITLYAQWKKNSYTINFNGGVAGIGQMNSISNVAYAQEITLPANVFVRTGYHFLGWGLSASDTQATYLDSATVSMLKGAEKDNESITLYAIWEVNGYKVKFNGNGATSGEMTYEAFDYLEQKALTANAFEKVGYTFIGWAKETNGSVQYADESVVEKLTAEKDGEVTLYAKWQANAYIISYDGQGSSNNINNTNMIYDVEANLSSSTPLKTGYSFVSWNSKADGTGTSYASGQAVMNLSELAGAEVALYAQYTPITYQIKYNANDEAATGEMANQTLTYDKSEKLNANAFAKVGYLFAGWSKLASGEVEFEDEAEITSNLANAQDAVVNLYAKWDPITYTVEFLKNNADATIKAEAVTVQEFTYDTQSSLLDVSGMFNLVGYHFAAWNSKADGTGNAFTNEAYVENLTAVNGATVTLYAEWEPNEYTVKLVLGNGSENVEITLPYLANIPAQADPSRTGYTFAGWSKDIPATMPIGGDTISATWNIITYNISYNLANGETNNASNPATYNYESETIYLENPSKDYYTFGGWYSNSEFNGEAVTQITKNSTGDVVVYPKFTPITYSISYNLDGGTNGANPTSYNAESEITFIAPIKEGYHFIGWYDNAGYNGDAITQIAAGSHGDLSLHAKFEINTYTVRFNANSALATGTMADQSWTYGEWQRVTPNAFVRPGYKFVCWNKMADGSGAGYSDNVNTLNISSTNGAVVDFYAQWKLDLYTISYDLAGGSVVGNPSNYTILDEDIIFYKPTKAGYIFAGWTGTDLESPTINVTIPAGSYGNRSYVATWTPITYIVHFDKNDADATGTMADQTFTYDAIQAIRANAFEKEYWVFSGWSLTASGAVAYDDAANLTTNLANTLDAEVTLYAIWRQNEFILSFDSQGGSSVSPIIAEAGDPISAPANPTRLGYTFGGWFEEAGCTNEYAIPSVMPSADKKVYAKWTLDTYTISYDLAGGSATNPESYNVTSAAITLANPTRAGYTFAGWTGTDLEAASTSVTIPAGSIGARSYVATWNIITYNITYTLNGGTNGANPATYNVESATIELANPTKAGYTFGGWYGDAEFNGSKVSQIANGSTGDVEVYAKWTANTYTVSFNANTGLGSMAAQTFTYDEAAKALSTNEFTKVGYTFGGWNTKADGSGVNYADEELIRNLVESGSVELFAKWTAITYTVKFNANGGSGSMANQARSYNDGASLTAVAFTKTGYTFEGWATTATGSVAYADKNATNLTATQGAAIELFAIWSENSYTLRINLNGINRYSYIYYSLDYETAYAYSAITGDQYNYIKYVSHGVIDSDTFALFNADPTGRTLLTVNTISYNEYLEMTGLGLPAYEADPYYDVLNASNYSMNGYEGVLNYTEELNIALRDDTFFRYGYTFVGWSLDKDATEATYPDGATVSGLSTAKNGSATLYAIWVAKTYKINYSANYLGATQSMPISTFKVDDIEDGHNQLSQCIFTRPGYTFTAWMFNSLKYQPSVSMNLVSNPDRESYTVFAVWQANTYSVQFNANGGTGSMANQAFTYAVAQNLTANAFTKAGSLFAGWAVEAEGSVVYTNNQSVSNLTPTKDGIVTLYAVWEKSEISISFNANGGTGSMDGQGYKYNDAQEIRANAFTKEGYHFVGWATTATGSVAYTDGQSAVFTASTTLYAIWEANTYTVSFNGNGGAGSMSEMNFTYGVPQELASNSFAKEGYVFSGWALTPTGVKAYNEKEAANNITATNNGVVTLYAVWTPITYTIKFDGNGADSGSMSDLVVSYDVNQALTENEFTKTGFEFAGWSLIQNGSVQYDNGQVVSNLYTTSGQEITLFAVWALSVMKVQYNANGGLGHMADSSFETSGKIKSYSFTKEGYHFKEWNTLEDGTGTSYAEGVTVTSSLTLYAIWEVNTFKVQFNGNGALGSMADLNVTYGVSTLLTANAFTKVGYTFAGWALSSGGSTSYANEAEVSALTNENNATIVLYAKWQANTYTVTFDSNGGVGSITDMACTYDVTQAIPAINEEEFYREGFEFAGWSTVKDGAVIYADSGDISNLTSNNGEIVTLYAKWVTVYRSVIVYEKINGVEGSIIDNGTVGVQNRGNKINGSSQTLLEYLNTDSTIQAHSVEGKTLVGFYYNNKLITDTTKFQAASGSNVVVYACYSVALVVDTSEMYNDGYNHNIIVDLSDKDPLHSVHNAYEYFPDIKEIDGYTYVIEASDLSNVSASVSAKIKLIERNDSNRVASMSGSLIAGYKYSYTESSASSQYNGQTFEVYELYEGTHTFSSVTSFVIVKGDNVSVSGNVVTIANKIGFAILLDNNGKYYQIHSYPLLSSFSISSGYHDYTSTIANISNTKFIDKNTIDPYAVGAANFFKLRFALASGAGQTIYSSDVAKHYEIVVNPGLTNEFTLEQQYQEQIEIDGEEYSGYVYGLSSTPYMYVLENKSTDKAYDLIKFTSELVGKNIKVTVSPANRPSDRTSVIEMYYTVNDGVNVETNDELREAYGDLSVLEINIHAKIICKLMDCQFNDYWNANFPHTPLNYEERKAYEILHDNNPATTTGDVYVRASKSAISNNQLVINGNYFTIDGSGLEIVEINTATGQAWTSDQVGSSNGEYMNNSAYAGYYIKTNKIAIFGTYLSYISNYSNYSNEYKNENNGVTYNNMYIIGNTITPMVNFGADKPTQLQQVQLACYNSGGYSGLRSHGDDITPNNVVIDYCNFGICCEMGNPTIAATDTYIYYSWAHAIYTGWGYIRIDLKNSELRYSGGPCLMLDGFITPCANIADEEEKQVVSIDSSTKIINWIVGNEIWLQLYSMSMVSSLAAGIQQLAGAMSAGASGTGTQYSMLKSYNNLSTGENGDTAYSLDYSNSSILFNFAFMCQDRTKHKDSLGNPKFAKYDVTFESALGSGYNAHCEIGTIMNMSTPSFASTQQIGASYPAASSLGGQHLFVYPVSPISQYANSLNSVMGGAAYAGNIAQVLGFRDMFNAPAYAQLAQGAAQAAHPGSTRTDWTFDETSAFAIASQTSRVYEHDKTTPTEYSWLECGIEIDVAGEGMVEHLFVYSYQGKGY